LELEKTHLIATNLSFLTFLWHSVTFTFTILNTRLSRIYCPYCTTKTVVQFFPLLGG